MTMKFICANVLALVLASVVPQVNAQSTADNIERLTGNVLIDHQVIGRGVGPTATDTVLVHYRGMLVDGTEFDSSYKRNKPTSFPLNSVIPCWTTALQEMAEGSKAKITCPAATAYGARAVGDLIPANSDLMFEIEL